MPSYKKILTVCLLAAALTLNPLATFASQKDTSSKRKIPPPDPGTMLADLVLARPLGLVATVAGSVIFIVSVPFSAVGGNTDEAFDSLVVTPAEYTFGRPLGRFEDY